METKKDQSRGRPRKDYWDLKNKIAQKAAENKWKFGRGRPKKEKKIDDSLNTKISNHHKDVNELEKKNNEIRTTIGKITQFCGDIPNNKKEKISKIFLWFSVTFFLCAIIFTLITKLILPTLNKDNILSVSETENISNENDISLQIWYNDQNWEFVEIENIDVDNSDFGMNNESQIVDENVWIIQSFYDSINNKEFSELSNMADIYLKKSDSFRTYFNENWLSKFLNKIVWNKVFIGEFHELPSTKPDVKKYWYTVKYKLNWNHDITKEEREIAIVNRNDKKLVWSIMCITTWCSRMPFFQP